MISSFNFAIFLAKRQLLYLEITAVDRTNILLDLPFKGSRPYLHSTDILSELTELGRMRFGSDSLVDSLILRKPFIRNIQVLFDVPAEYSGSFHIRRGAERIAGWLVQSNSPVSRRVPFDSSPLIASAMVSYGAAKVLQPVPDYRPIDAMVGLMKILAHEVEQQQWWLYQMNFDVALREVYPIEVRTRLAIGTQCIVFDVLQTGNVIGSARVIKDGGIHRTTGHPNP